MSGPDRDPERDAAWRRQLAALGGEEPVQPESMQRTVEALRQAGALRPGPGLFRLARLLLPLAAGIVLFLAGGWWGRSAEERAGGGDAPRFVLLLLEDSTFQGARLVSHDSLVAEYSAWAGTLARNGNLILGEELGDRVWPLGLVEARDAPAARITGLFILSAPNAEAALTIARSCPHLKYGGGILVRPIQTTS